MAIFLNINCNLFETWGNDLYPDPITEEACVLELLPFREMLKNTFIP